MRRLIREFLVGVAITVATLCVLEGASSAILFARDYYGATAPKGLIRPYTMPDTLLGWVSRPGFSSPDEYGQGIGLTTTSLGFRGTGTPDSSNSSGGGLVCSGDAYTLAIGVSDEHSWCATLGRIVPALRTYNMGQAGYGLDQSALWYQRDGGRVPHQIQLLGITAGQLDRMTTRSDAGRYKPTFAVENGRLVVRGVPVPKQTTDALRRARRERVKYDLRMVQAFTEFTGIDSRAEQAQRIDEQWPLVELTLDGLAASNGSHGSRLVLAYLPTRRDLKTRSSDERRRKLEGYAQRRGIPFVDLTLAMRAMRADSLDLSFISRVPRGAAPGVTNQYSDLGNAWVARSLATALSPLAQRAAIPVTVRVSTR